MSDTQIAKQPETLLSLLSNPDVRKRFDEVLKDKSAAFTASLLSLYTANQPLQEADPRSILQSAMIAATLDLPINQSLGRAFIVPYGKFAQFQIGARGFVELALRTGKYETMNVTEIYRDEFKRWDPLTGEFESTAYDTWKLRDKQDPKDVVGYYAFFKLVNGFKKAHYLTIDQIKSHARKFSKSFENPRGAWMTNFDAMAKKTVLKGLLSKYGLLSIQMEKAVEADQGVIKPKDMFEGEIAYDDLTEDEPVATKPTGAGKKINEDQKRLLEARITKSGIDREEVKLYVKTKFSKEHFADLSVEELTAVVKWLENEPGAAA